MVKKINRPFIPVAKFNKKWTILFIAYLVIGSIVTLYFSESRWNRMIETYQLVDIDSEFEGVVWDIYQKQFTFVTLNNKTQLRFMPLRNHAYQPFSFSSFLQLGDLIYKREASDTIFIVRNEIKYHFVIGAHL